MSEQPSEGNTSAITSTDDTPAVTAATETSTTETTATETAATETAATETSATETAATETAATETTTLAGRTEVIGRTYPSWVEKLIFLSAVGGAIWLSLWIWQSSDWHVAGKWTVSLCGLPILVLIITEAIGRVIQSRVPR